MKFSKIKTVKSPERGSAGINFFIPDQAFKAGFKTILPGEGVLIPSGIKVEVPEGFTLIAFNESGVAVKKGLSVGASVVDPDYQGEVHLHLVNTSPNTQIIRNGEKIVQFLLIPIHPCEPEQVLEQELFEKMTIRSKGGFGHTGI